MIFKQKGESKKGEKMVRGTNAKEAAVVVNVGSAEKFKDTKARQKEEKTKGPVNPEADKDVVKSSRKSKEEKAMVGKKVKTGSRFTKRALFFGVINLLAIVFLLILQSELPKKALELKTLINAGIRAEASSKINYTDLELESNKELINKISKLFPDDQGLVDFIKTMEDIKTGGVLVSFSFASKKPVRDKTGNPGIPSIAQFRGTWEQIDSELQKVQEAPYLFRPITVEIKTLPEENMVELMYGGFLYVDENL